MDGDRGEGYPHAAFLGSNPIPSRPPVLAMLKRGRMRFLPSVCLAILLSTAPLAALAQADPTATRTPIQAGAAFSFASPDYDNNSVIVNPYIQGGTAFADIGLARRISAEVEYRDLNLITPRDFGEKTFLAGPRYSFALEDRANLYIKAMGGMGQFVFNAPSYAPQTQSYGVVALGAGIEFRISRHINARPIDVEYQKWLSFPGGLSPFVASIGFAYVY
jgi:hypothetical protein